MNKYLGLNITELHSALKAAIPIGVAGASLLLFTERGQNVIRDVGNDLFAPKISADTKSPNVLTITGADGQEVSSVYKTRDGTLMVCIPSLPPDKEICGENNDDFDQSERPVFSVLQEMAKRNLFFSSVRPK